MKPLLNLSILFLISFSTSAQEIYFFETFDECVLPTNLTTEEESTNSQGWTVGNSSLFTTDLMPYPHNDGNCFIGNSDIAWDDENGDLNDASSDKLLLPFLDLSSVENLILSIDYLSGYGAGIKAFFRTEDSDWSSIYNFHCAGGMLTWQNKSVHIFGHVNAPIKDLSDPIQIMFEFTDHGFSKFLGVGLDNIKLFEAPNQDVSLMNVHIPPVIPVGEFPIKPGIINRGSYNLNELIFEWRIDDGPINSHTFSEYAINEDFSINYIVPFGSGIIPSPNLLIDFPEEGTYTFKAWLRLPNNLDDNNEDDNYWEQEVIVMNELPIKEYVYEKFSHNTCGPCYDADLLAKEIQSEFENINIVSVHSAPSDPMDYPPVDEIDIAYSQRAHPSTLIDRRFMDMYENGKMNSLYEFLPHLSTPWYSPVALNFTSKEISATQISLEIEAEFIAPLEGEYRFNIWTLENGIVNYQTSAPQGDNYIHNNVLRNYSGGNYGEEASLPQQISTNTKYTYSAIIDIDPEWDVDSLEFLAIVQKFTPDSDDREIINSLKINIADPIIVSNVEEEILDFFIYPNPSNDFIHIVLDKKINSELNMSIYNMTGDLIQTQFYNNLQQNYIQYDISKFASGNYLVVLESENGKQIKQFSVTH